MFSSLGPILGSVAGVFTVLAALFRGHDTVPEGSLGLKFRFGAVCRDKYGNPKVIPPGWVWLMPIAHTLKHMEVRKRQAVTHQQGIQLADAMTYEIIGFISFGLSVPHRSKLLGQDKEPHGLYYALCELENNGEALNPWVASQLSIHIRQHLLETTATQNWAATEAALQAKATQFFAGYGISVLEVGFILCSPTWASQDAMLAGVRLTAQAEATASLLELNPGDKLPDWALAALASGSTTPRRTIPMPGTSPSSLGDQAA